MKTPFNVLAKHNSWDKAPRDPYTVGNFIIGTLLNTSTSYLSVIWLTGFVATTLVAGALMRALMPKPPKMQEGLLGNFRQAAAPWDVVYGQVRKGGTITYMESTGDTNKYLHMIVTLAGHEVEEIGDIYINDKVVTIDSNDEVTSEPWVSGSGGADKWITIKKFTGASNQNIYNSLQSMTDGPTFENEGQTNTPSNFKGEGISCIYVRMEYNRDVFASGIPSFSAVVKGKKVYDPRTSTTGWSANAALCTRDYLISEYGLNTPTATIDDTYFSTAATDCDTSSGSGESNKFEINGVITTGANIRTNLQDMVGACVGNLYYSAGQFKLVAGAYSASVKTLTLDDLRSEISLNTKSSRRDNFNSVQGTFIWAGVDDGTDSGGDWTEFDYPPITSPTFVTEDNGLDNPLELNLPLTTGSATAQRIAKQTLFRAREQMSFSAEFGMNAFDLEIGDTVSLTLDRYGWDEKEFEVVSWGFKADQDAGDLRVTLSLKETSAASYSWDAEESDIIGNNSNLPVASDGLAINNLTVSGGGRTQGDGTFINSAILNWDDVSNAFSSYYEVEWKALADSTYSSTTTVESSVEISPLVDGVAYIFRVRAVTATGVTGAYSTVQFTGGGDVTAPGLPTAITADGGFRYITVRWTNPADADLNFVEVWENTSNSSSGATKVGVSGGSEFVRSDLGIQETRYYFLKSVDYSGNASAFTSGVSATTTFIDDDDFANGVYSLFTDQGLYAIEDVTSLPASGDFTGQKVFNRTDGKLYQWTGSAWEQAVGGAEDFSDLTGAIAGAQVPDGLIDSLKLADDAVTNAKIATNAITADVIASGAITETKISSGAITTPKIAAGAITASEIAAGSITSSQIAADTIAASNIAAGAITADEIASNAITSAKIDAGAIIADKIAANAITGAKIAAGEITGDKITANTITGGLIAASGIITNSAQITDGVVTNAKIQNAAITSAKIQDLAVTSAKIGSLNADKITAGVLNAARIPTLSTNKFSTMSGLYGNRSGDTDSPAASGTITSFTYTPSSASVALLTLFIQGVLQQRPGGEGSYSFTIEVFVNSSLVLSTGGVGNTDGAVGVTLQGNYAFSAPANTSQTVTVGWRQYNGRKGKLQINNGVISSIFTQD